MAIIRIHNNTKLSDQELITKLAIHGFQLGGYYLLTPGVTFQFYQQKTGMTIYAGDNTATNETIKEMQRENAINH